VKCYTEPQTLTDLLEQLKQWKMKIQGKKLVVTSISHNNKATSDKHAVWKRKQFTWTLYGGGRCFWTFLWTTPSI